METSNRPREAGSPPMYSSHAYEPLKEEIEFQNSSGRNIQSTVVTIMPEGPPVRDHIIWSLFNAMYMNFCCLGVLALVFSVKSRDRKLLGDKNGAHNYGSTARSLNIAATVLSILTIIVVVIIIIVQVVMVIETAEAFREHNRQRLGEPGFGK